MSERFKEETTEETETVSNTLSAESQPQTAEAVWRKAASAVLGLFSGNNRQEGGTWYGAAGKPLTLEKYVGLSRARAIRNGNVYTVDFGMSREKSLDEYAEEFIKDEALIKELIEEIEQELENSESESR